MKVKQKSFISNNNSKNSHYRPNSSNKSRFSQHKLIINNSLTELYPPITFTMPKTRQATHMGNLITKEELYEENFQLKNSLKRAKKELEEVKKSLFKKGLELEKKEKIINDCTKENVTDLEHELNLNKAKESSLLTLCRKKYSEMKSKYEKECKQNEILRMNIKLTKLKEYQTQIDAYQKELQKILKLYNNSKEKLDKALKEINDLNEIKNEFINQHSLINVLRKKCEDLTDNITTLQEENNFLKNEIEKNQMIQKKLKRSNVKLRISNEKFMKMKKMKEGSYIVNKNNIIKLNNLQKDLKEYKDLYEKTNYEYLRITNNIAKKDKNIVTPDLLDIQGINFLNSKIIEKKIENNQEELYKSLLNNEKLKNKIFEKYLKDHGINTEKILKEKGYDGIIRKENILHQKSSKNFISENNSQNTKCGTSEGNKENFEQSRKLNYTQSNLDNNFIINEENKSNITNNNINNKQSFTQEQLRDSGEDNFENIPNNNDLNENPLVVTESQNSEIYLQDQYKTDNHFITLSNVFIKNLEANHINKDNFISKIKEISAMFVNKDEISKEEFLEPFFNLFINLMKVTNDNDVFVVKEFLINLIEESEGDTNKFFLELIDIAHNIIDYTLIENEEEILNAFAIELQPFKEKLKSNLEKYENNLINFDSLKKIFDELKINLSDDYYQFLLYKMKENTAEKSSIFDLNYKVILDLLERDINLNGISNNLNPEENKIIDEETETEEEKINIQVGLVLKELKQAMIKNKTNFEDECRSIIHNLEIENKKVKGIDKDDFFRIFKKYKIEIDENAKNYIFDLFKVENSVMKDKENDMTLIDYDKIWTVMKN
jgi:hypothetical protein